jgi:hypothetical protein
MSLHRSRQRNQAAEVVAVVLQRLAAAFADGLVGGEVHHRVDALALEQRLQRGLVAHVGSMNSGRWPASRSSRFSTSGELL